MPDLRKHLWLQPTDGRAEALSADARGAASRQLTLVRQRAEACETLHAAGHRAEALRLVVSGLAPALEALEALADPEAPATKALRERLVAARDALADGAPSELEADLGAADVSLLTEAVDALGATVRHLTPLAMSVTERRTARGLRVLALATVIAAVAAASWWAFVVPPPNVATASGVLGDSRLNGAPRAIDGDPATAWLLPDNTPGHLEVRLGEPGPVSAVRLLNVDRDLPDVRASRDYRVELFSNGEVVDSVEGRWGRAEGDAEWERHEVDAARVDRIRFTATTWFPLGGGLAELAWE